MPLRARSHGGIRRRSGADQAGEGVPNYLWAHAAEDGQTPLDVGTGRAKRESGGFSYRNANVACLAGEVVGMVLGYPLEAPTDEERGAVASLPEPIRPFVALEQHEASAGTFYVNALAVLPEFRGQGIGVRLMGEAERHAGEAGIGRMSVQVFSQNAGAARFYRRLGYREAARDRVLLHPGPPWYDEDVLLLVKDRG